MVIFTFFPVYVIYFVAMANGLFLIVANSESTMYRLCYSSYKAKKERFINIH